MTDRTDPRIPQLCPEIPGAPRTETGLYFVHGAPFAPRDILDYDPDDFAITQIRIRPEVAPALETFEEMGGTTAEIETAIGGGQW